MNILFAKAGDHKSAPRRQTNEVFGLQQERPFADWGLSDAHRLRNRFNPDELVLSDRP